MYYVHKSCGNLAIASTRHGSVAMVADRFIALGEELSFVYVSAPDAVLLVQYAMAPEHGNVRNMAGSGLGPWGHLKRAVQPGSTSLSGG